MEKNLEKMLQDILKRVSSWTWNIGKWIQSVPLVCMYTHRHSQPTCTMSVPQPGFLTLALPLPIYSWTLNWVWKARVWWHSSIKKWMTFFLHFHSWQFPHNSYELDWVLGRERCRNSKAQKIELGNILKIDFQAKTRNSQIHFKSQQCKFKGLNYSRISCA